MTAPRSLVRTGPLRPDRPKEITVNTILARRAGTMAAVAGLAAASLALATPPALGSPALGSPALGSPGKTNCVADLTGRAPVSCFATLTEAMALATGGRLTNAPRTGAKALADRGFAASVDGANAGSARAVAASDIVISIEYDLRDHDETGGTLIWRGDKECSTRTTDVDYEISSYSVSAPAWVNRITSYQAFGNCWTKHFENANFGGASVGFHGSRTYIGAAMDNRTSSEQWS